MNRFSLILVVTVCWWLSGCVNLKLVSTFCATSAGGLQRGTSLSATFTDIYQQRVLADSLDNHPFNRVPLVGIDFDKRIRADSLRSYQLADSLIRSGTLVVSAYFQALAALSATGDSFVPVQLKSPAFSSFLQSPAGNLSADETAAFNRVANLLASTATGAYRRRKVAILLAQSHADVNQLLNVLRFAYERLAQVIDLSRDQQYVYYKNVVIRDPALSYLQKLELARQWLQTAKAIEQNRQATLTHVKMVKTLQSGYNDLYNRRKELSGKATLVSLGTSIATLNQLRVDLEQLTPVYGRFKP
ncbi:hypothetical protein GCM10027341_45120 [Spirosoma knui]